MDEDNRRKKIRKFKESAWKCIYFLSSEILSLSVTYNEPWFRSTKYYWVGPGDQVWPDQMMKYDTSTLFFFSHDCESCSRFLTLSVNNKEEVQLQKCKLASLIMPRFVHGIGGQGRIYV